MVEHFLGKVGGVDVCLNAQIAEHGVGFPSAKELDDILVDVRTEESSCSPGTETTSGERSEVNISEGTKASGGMPEAIGDPVGLHVAECVGGVVVGTERRVGWCIMLAEVFGDAEECFCRAKQRVIGGVLSHLFATNAVLLVRECQSRGVNV